MHSSQAPSHDELQRRFSEACLLHQQGSLSEAKSIYIELFELTQSPLLLYNLGLIHHEEGSLAIALQCFETAAEAMPEDPDCLFNLALCLKACDRLEDSVTIYNKVVSLDSENSDAVYNLASVYRELKDYEQAISCYLRVLERVPDHISAVNNLAYVYQLAGDTEQAAQTYQRLLELDPEHEAAQHMLSAITGTTPDSSPDSYVREVFDNYSERYEQSLTQELQYNVPEKLRHMFESLPDTPAGFQHGFDLGCGTGLGAQPFVDIVQAFDGVDLSQKMIDIAASKEIYSTLFTNNICEALRATSTIYDFLLAADVFGYIGDLNELFMQAGTCCSPNCYFLFSTETTEKGNYTLRPTGRFAHSIDYICTVSKQHGWQLCHTQKTNLRMDKGEWVTGNLWILKKSAASD